MNLFHKDHKKVLSSFQADIILFKKQLEEFLFFIFQKKRRDLTEI